MAENTKSPSSQDQRQRTAQGDANKSQKQGSPVPAAGNQDRGRPSPSANPGSNPASKKVPPDKTGGDPNKMAPDKDRVSQAPDDDDDDLATQRVDRDDMR